ncbi:hypothetical protein EXIGLDRAFT_343664 [Exidia glandulosa HHB12029]|uniref:Secreted protein n=1 Tax=Exidia glandulosa HHB12029 TaxID=1314781 RepID=A0A166B4T6_EXIGL|nr:hypothetical protein EXIGLDRAFT_343664 [Exidia glandulosa HHB12029]
MTIIMIPLQPSFLLLPTAPGLGARPGDEHGVVLAICADLHCLKIRVSPFYERWAIVCSARRVAGVSATARRVT